MPLTLTRIIKLTALALLLSLAASKVCSAQPASPPAGATPEQALAFWEEQAFWETIKDSKKVTDFEAYLRAYPNGRFVPLAQAQIKALQAPGASSPPSPTTGTAPPANQKTFRDCSDCPLMVMIAPGKFNMGVLDKHPEERPVHTVTIAAPFAIGVYEITIGEWDACLREGGCKYTPDPRYGTDQRLPISNVSWNDAQGYVNWLSKKTGESYRLPSEAEWEYAARGGTTTTYWWGLQGKGSNMANCTDCGSRWDDQGTAPVGSFRANPFGLYDVHGNVWEWVADCWNRSYEGAPNDGSVWVRGDCIERVQRGGAWKLDAEYMRVSRRGHYDRDVRYYLNGFRVVKTLR